jgi:hypothetical protein
MQYRAKKYKRKQWYEREHLPYAADRKIVEEYVHWIKDIDWKVFGTFTVAWQASDQQAEKIFAAFIDRLEGTLGCDVCYVRGDEKRFSGCGKPACARHFHALLTYVAPVNACLIACLWKDMAGNRSDDAGALVEEYNASENGARYVLKCINQPDGNWAFRKLELFHPTARSLHTVDARWRRRLRRHKARQQKVSSATGN